MSFIEFELGVVEQGVGNAERAHEHYQSTKAMLEAQYKQNSTSKDYRLLGYLSAKLGQRKQALAQFARADREAAASKQFDPFRSECEDKDDTAWLQATLGNAGAAVEALDWLLARPAGNVESVPLLKIDPTWDPIRKDPRFQALLKKYSQPVPASAASAITASTAINGADGGE
jgi:hypothetical protein